jgi:outer membrane protein OmpA-like peptidoglycan-associated protein
MDQKLVRTILVGIVLLLVATPALAWQGYNADMLRLSLFGGNFVALEDSDTLKQWSFGGSLFYVYTNSPYRTYEDTHILSTLNENDEWNFDIISELHSAHLTTALGLTNWMSLGAEIPYHFMTRRRTTIEDVETLEGLYGPDGKPEELESDPSAGDGRVELKFKILNQEDHWLGLAFGPYMTFLLGGDKEGFLSEGRNTGGATLAFEHDFSFINIGANAGYQYRRGNQDAELAHLANTDVGDALKWGLGFSRVFENGLSFSLEYFGSWFDVADREFFHKRRIAEGSDTYYSETVGEGLFTVRYQFGGSGPRVIAGAGPGVNRNEGTPEYRALAGVDYYWEKQEVTEGDLMVNVVDEDDNPLSAAVRIIDPEGTETIHSAENGILELSLVEGDYQVFAKKDGYVSDSASDTIYKKGVTQVKLVLKKIVIAKKVPQGQLTVIVLESHTGKEICSLITTTKGEDKQTFKNDPGAFTKELKPGYYSILVESEGYGSKTRKVYLKDGASKTVEVKLNLILKKLDSVYFKTGSATILSKSYPVLNDIASQVKAMCAQSSVTVEIQGHTDNKGNADYNQKLSEKRAYSVRKYLIKKGVKASALKAVGYGLDNPIATNDTPDGRGKNRRVEFVVQ